MGRKGKNNKSLLRINNFTFEFDEYASIVNSLMELSIEPFVNNDTDVKRFFMIKYMVDEIRVKQQKFTLIKTNGTRKSNISRFESWCVKHGMKNNGVCISEFEYGYGLKATTDIKKEDIFLQIPEKIMLTTDTAKLSNIKELINLEKRLALDHVALTLHLLDEKLNPMSFWKPYLDVLPIDFNLPLYFTDEDFELLRGCNGFLDILNNYRYVIRQYVFIFKLFSTILHCVDKFPFLNLCIEDFWWAMSVVSSRQNNIVNSSSEHVIALIPYWDMCNHIDGKMDNISTFWNPDMEYTDCFANQDYNEGEEVKIFYGPRTNIAFLNGFGFVLKDNSCDRMTLTLGISQSDPLGSLKEKLLSLIKFKSSVATPTSRSRLFNLHIGNSPMNWELVVFLRVFSMTKDNLEYMLNDDLASGDPTNMQQLRDVERPIAGLDVKVWTYLIARLDLLLAYSDRAGFMKHTYIEDNEIKVKQDLPANQRLCINYRLGERRILECARQMSLRNQTLQVESGDRLGPSSPMGQL